ncbi:MAG TPA: rhodanese-like domain-containing protein [Burkholderiales bacterium]|nr:rhodanese-like domain-containing protein [Burkholderiales bacterium]
MGKVDEILKAAKERATEMNLPYAGALLPKEAYLLMTEAPNAKLVDVRSRAEWDWVGRVPGSVEIELLAYPGSQPNPNFLNQLKQQVKPDSLVMFICRSGQRSHNAAIVATQTGYESCFNVLEGFEGAKDSAQHRNTIGGWRVAGLPWVQN